MHALLRPALYSAYHLFKPSKLGSELNHVCADIVGPICETGILGLSVSLQSLQWDVFLIANASLW